MVFLSQRRRRPEIMDQPGLEPGRHVTALRDLARINFWSRSAGILWPPLAALARQLGTERVGVLDLASGGGDIAIRLWHKARRAGLDFFIEGRDLSPLAVEYARAAATRQRADVSFQVGDVLRGPLPSGFDAVICSLFLHHLDNDQAVTFLRRTAEAAGRLVLVNDLARGWVGLTLAHVGTRLLSRSPVVHFDGPCSVEGAFTPAEALALAEKAGLARSTVARRWPCRYLLKWERP
jgi:2-polyprenyl-3-methyl-5-hydroxy-6-metoxy-1,4-benzoquinol methylase